MQKPPLTPKQRAFREFLYIELLKPENLERMRRALDPRASGYDINGVMQDVADNVVTVLRNRADGRS